MSKHTPIPWPDIKPGRELQEIARLRSQNQGLLETLTHISLCCSNSMSSKYEIGKMARAAIAEARGEE